MNSMLMIVDDEPNVDAVIRRVAEPAGFDVVVCSSAPDAMAALSRRPAEMAFVDLRMPDTSGIGLLRQMRTTFPACEVVLMSGAATIGMAVEAVKLGARDFLVKPLEFPRIMALVQDVRDEAAKRQRLLAVESGLARELGFHGMLGRSAATQETFGLIRRLAPHVRTVLITGETGTGKELVAQALHAEGPRRSRRLVTVNCAAVAPSLFESELFGQARGAFTEATEPKEGLFEAAHQGTLFLDEVGELPLALQPKLLRVLDDGVIRRVGAIETRHVDVCVFAATSRDLQAEVAAGRFRSDLLFRLNVVEIELTPLRDRPEDIPYLTAAFVADCSRRLQKGVLGVTPAAERVLGARAWDGNVRELRNAIERACMLVDGPYITEREVTSSTRRPPAGTRLAPAAAAERVATERQHLVETLASSAGNKQAAARVLGISRRALYRRLERYGLHTAASVI